MGHGDDSMICDTNFPADAVALSRDGAATADPITSRAGGRQARSFSVLPLDSFVEHPVFADQIVGKPDRGVPGADRGCSVRSTLPQRGSLPMGSVERFAFYDTCEEILLRHPDRVNGASRLLRFKKGVIGPTRPSSTGSN